MSTSSYTTPRKDGRTERQGQEAMDNLLHTYWIDDKDGNMDRGTRAPTAPPAPKVKKSTRKSKPVPSKIAAMEEDSPSLRKSARVAAGVKRRASSSSDDVEETEQPPAKKLKQSTQSTSTSSPATIQKHTGRFTPIGSQLPRAKKIITRPAETEADDAATVNDSGDADVEDAGEPEQADETPSKGKAKKKMPKAFVGESDAMGSSVQKPEDAPNDEHWKCANRNCTSGQTWHNRDGPMGAYGRKVISNFFGRNKKETNLIHADVWHNYCRKDYQRGTYRVGVQSAKAKCKYYMDNIEMQLVRIKLWRPRAKFQVQLSKGASARLASYYKELNKNGNDEAKAKNSVSKTAEVNAKGKEKPLSLEDAFPIEYLKHFDDNFCAEDQSFDDIDNVLAWTKDLVERGQIESMPPMEFLIKKQTDNEEVIDPKYNYERWAAYEDGKEFVMPKNSDADEVKPEPTDEDGEETEVDSNAGEQQQGEELYGLADDESTDEDETESEAPQTPSPPNEKPKKKYNLFLTQRGTGPLSSTYGATPGSGAASKRKRDVSEDDSNESSKGTPSKKQNVGAQPTYHLHAHPRAS